MSKLEEIKALAEQVIDQGHADGLDADAVKMNMMTAGVPFSKLNSLFNSISIDKGYAVNPKDVTEGLKELIPEIPWADFTDWESQVQKAIDHLADTVDGATPARALTLARAFCKEEEIELPTKPRAGGGGGRSSKLAAAIVDLVVANPEATVAEAYAVVSPLVGGNMPHKNAMYYVNTTFAIALAAANGETLDVVTKALKEQPEPVPATPDADPNSTDEVEEDDDEE